ncbi:M13 family metallopeptidase [Rugamonas sp. CCM 8940]|uniref:M13 family metallopeptidase n=1 Tax=Rugamonas sp. CCM 8940 TaxID=2765359 RepID=UPI0018F77E2F|nr:M13 family metallopeptidase [Rugamonas sp. CCM 8940]MBJ7311744.1 M13 family metallopeptidase [Rugamonas sp. CCM 8940]
MQASVRSPRHTPLKIALGLALYGAALSAAPAFAAADSVPAVAGQPAGKAAPRAGDDFFDYVNGDWLNSVEIPADRSNWGVGAALVEDTNSRIVKLIEGVAADPAATAEAKKVAAYYASALDQDGIDAKGLAPLRAQLELIDAIADKAALTRALGAGLRADVDPLNSTDFFTENLFGLWIAQGLQDPAHNRPYLLQGGLGLPDRAYYLDAKPAMAKLRAQYLAHIAATFKLAGIDRADERAARVFALERKIAATHATREDSADVLKANNNWRAADFARKAPGLDWNALFASAGLAGQDSFIVWHPSAMRGAAALVGSVPLETWKDFLRFHQINHAHTVLPKALADQHFAFYGQTLTGTPQQPLRWKRALAAVNEAMPDAVGQLYVARYFPPQAKLRLQEMVGKIVDAFHHRIDQLNWMAPATKAEAHAKLKTLYVGVAYPDHWRSYDTLEVAPGDALGNFQRAEQFHTRQQLAKLAQPVDRTQWAMPAQLVNAVNLPMQNALNFPAAILQAPYFDPAASDAVNYGGIGATIGHEISHSFDDQGAQFDAQGRLRDWWTKADGAHFKQASAALAKQYSAYKPFPDLAINGQQTLSENLADLAGLAAAYDAYRATLRDKPVQADADQQFFVGYAMSWREKMREPALRQGILTDGHSPDKWRTATVRNLDAWYPAFDVQPGQTLYLAPKERVRVW